MTLTGAPPASAGDARQAISPIAMLTAVRPNGLSAPVIGKYACRSSAALTSADVAGSLGDAGWPRNPPCQPRISLL
jgi:hypothetical protein